MSVKKKFQFVLSLFFIATLFGFTGLLRAQDSPNGFSLQVTPSPLIATLTPGKTQTLELKIRNGNSVAEDLKMGIRAFSVDNNTGEITIADDGKEEVENFISFEQETFRVEAGEWMTQRLLVETPEDAGFSYSFAVLISRQEPSEKLEGGSNIEGSVAVFTLLNVDRPDAVKKLELSNFLSVKKSYEYLPAEFELSIKNTGNTNVQPGGSIYIGRTGEEQQPEAVLQINPNGGYVVPDSVRVLQESWNDGFPSRNEQGKLVWDWSKLNKLKIGRYTAKAVLVYDDGSRDVPIESSVTFWVLPWKILVGLLIILIILIVGLVTVIKKSLLVMRTKSKEQTDS